MVLFAGTAILAFQDDFAEPVLGFDFWHGWFYKVLLALPRRLRRGARRRPRLLRRQARDPAAVPPPLLATRRARRAIEDQPKRYRLGDWIFLGSLFFLAFTGFLLEAFRIAARRSRASRSGRRSAGRSAKRSRPRLRGGAAADARAVDWWVHGVFALFWVSSIPFTKAVHMLAGPAGVAREGRPRRKPPSPRCPRARRRRTSGTRSSTRSRRSTSLDLDACTKCGKCHAACPATASGYPLSPRDLVLDLREVAEGSMGNRAVLGIEPQFPEHAQILGTIKPETLWSCMQCMACVEICPVGIEHVPIINQMRRALVEKGEMDGQLQQTLETIHTSGNSFGEAEAQARPLGEGPRLRDQGRAQDAGRGALVRRRLRLLRPAQSEGEPGARAHPSPCGRRLRDPLRRRANGGKRRTPGRRGRPVRRSCRGERRHDLRVPVRPDPHVRPAQLQHPQERVPPVRRHLGRRYTIRSSSSSCSSRSG